jgi:undecaprenyl-diphosphatase
VTDRRARRRDLFAIVGLTLAFVAFALVAKLDPSNAIDRDIAHAVRSTDALDPVWRAASWFGQMPWSVALPLVAFAGVLFVSRRDALGLAISVIGVEALGQVTRLAIDRPRPGDEVLHEKAGMLSSFPSGHVTLYVALFGFLAIVARARIRARAPRVAVVAALVAVIALVGPSRVYLAWHWPTDVAGSYALAGAWLVVAAHLRQLDATRTRSASQV